MRRFSFQFAVLLAVTLISASSVSAAETPSFGILGGLHLANLAINPDPTDASLDYLRKANVGGFIELGLNPHASLQARCTYVQKGAGLEEIAEEIRLRATTVIDYITVPVLLKIQAGPAKIRPYAVVGPELGFKIRAQASIAAGSYVPGEVSDFLEALEEELSDQVDNYSKSTDVALDFGGGVEIPTGRVSILMEGTYSLGLRNIAIPEDGEEGSAKTRTFLFNVGVRF